MLAYKFRPSEKLDKVIDIVQKKRLYCSDWSILNDPLEGYYCYSPHDSHRASLLTNTKKKYRICALSKTYGKRLLWSHYANGFDGVAVEVDLPTGDLGRTFYDVIYQSRHPEADLHDNQSLDEKALYILKHKHADWAYEEEVRIIQQEQYYELVKPVKSIIVGDCFNAERLRELHLLCEQHTIALKCARLEDEGVFAIDCRDT